jgi:heat shock protein HslJ
MLRKSATLFAAILGLAGVVGQAVASHPPLVCFGTEPFWSLDLREPGRALFSTPDMAAVQYQGAAQHVEHLQETLWRGANGEGGVLVAWLQDSACSDNMSDTEHSVKARVSLPDGGFLAGCCRVEAPAVAGMSLQNQTWVLQELSGIDSKQLEALERPVTVRFADGKVNGFSACNRFFGGYQQEADRLVIGNLGSTMMACESPAAEIERSFQSAFAGELQATLDGANLRLTSASGTALRFVPEPVPSLEGVSWTVKNYNNGRQAVVGVMEGATLTLQFGNGEVFGDAGCNSFRGSFKTAGDRIEFGPLGMTRRACSEGLMVQEQEFLAALTSSVSWTIDGGVLDMHRADSERTIWAVQQQ